MTLSEIQETSLKLMRDVHDFCINNNIHYTLAYGTLLGAIRHKGFIPWDDDIDVMMPRKDWEKFNKTYKSKCGYKILTAYDKRSFQIYTKVYEAKNTEVVSPAIVSTIDLGVWIDILPIDGLPDEPTLFYSSYNKMCKLFKVILSKRFEKTIGFSLRRMLWLIKHGVLFKSIHDCIMEFHKIAQTNTFEKSIYCSNLCCREALNKNKMEVLFTEDFKNYILKPFENDEFYVASGYDRILHNIFGDYMKLPPKEKRVVGHSSFHYYIKDDLK